MNELHFNLESLTCHPLICTMNHLHHRLIASNQMEKFISIQRVKLQIWIKHFWFTTNCPVNNILSSVLSNMSELCMLGSFDAFLWFDFFSSKGSFKNTIRVSNIFGSRSGLIFYCAWTGSKVWKCLQELTLWRLETP